MAARAGTTIFAAWHSRFAVSDVDLVPFQLVADAFLLGRRESTEAFFD